MGLSAVEGRGEGGCACACAYVSKYFCVGHRTPKGADVDHFPEVFILIQRCRDFHVLVLYLLMPMRMRALREVIRDCVLEWQSSMAELSALARPCAPPARAGAVLAWRQGVHRHARVRVSIWKRR